VRFFLPASLREARDSPLEFPAVRGQFFAGRIMKFHLLPLIATIVSSAAAAEVPGIFSGMFSPGAPTRAQVGMVVPPPEIDKYVAKVESAARGNTEWFREFSAKAKPGVPLPFDERLGLTREEYDEYIALWNKREFKPVEDVMLMLREGSGGTWTLASTGAASSLSTLRYSPDGDVFRSPNGELKRIEDINADASSILGEWTGKEWKFEEETGLGKTKENFALGRMAGGRFGLVVYRMQELSSEGTRLLDRSVVIRFPLQTPAPVKVTPRKKP
jgi:hypothetical protein